MKIIVILMIIFPTFLYAKLSPIENLRRIEELSEKMNNASSGKLASIYKKYIEQSLKKNSIEGSDISDKEYSIMKDEKKLLEFADKNGTFFVEDK